MYRRPMNRHLDNIAVFVFFYNVLEKEDNRVQGDNKAMDNPFGDTYLEQLGLPVAVAVADNAYKDIDS